MMVNRTPRASQVSVSGHGSGVPSWPWASFASVGSHTSIIALPPFAMRATRSHDNIAAPSVAHSTFRASPSPTFITENRTRTRPSLIVYPTRSTCGAVQCGRGVYRHRCQTAHPVNAAVATVAARTMPSVIPEAYSPGYGTTQKSERAA